MHLGQRIGEDLSTLGAPYYLPKSFLLYNDSRILKFSDRRRMQLPAKARGAIQPLLLLREASIEAGMQRLEEVGDQIGHHFRHPKRSRAALQGMGVLGLSLSDPAMLAKALDGTYARDVWADQEQRLTSRWPSLAGDIATMFRGDAHNDPGALRDRVFAALASINSAEDPPARALRFVWRGWHLRDQVVGCKRPMSLIPAVGGEVLSDVTSFTPVLSYLGESQWRFGCVDDPISHSPATIIADRPSQALIDARKRFSRLYSLENSIATDRLKALAREAYTVPAPHITDGVLRLELEQGGLLMGGVHLEPVSHGQIWRLVTPRRGTLNVRCDPKTAIACWRYALDDYGLELAPPEAESVESAYLQLAKAGALQEEVADTGNVNLPAGYAVGTSVAAESVAVSWLDQPVRTHDGLALAVVAFRADHGVLCAGSDATLCVQGQEPATWRTAQTSVNGVPLRNTAWRRAVSAWAICAVAEVIA